MTNAEIAEERGLTLNRLTNTYYDEHGHEYRDEHGQALYGERKLREYEVAFTFTDSTSVAAYDSSEAYELAQEVFSESGYDNLAGELDIIGVGEITDGQ